MARQSPNFQRRTKMATIMNNATASYTLVSDTTERTISSNDLEITYNTSNGISLVKTASPTSFSAGSIITFRIRITNTSSTYFTGVRIIDNLGGGNLAYVLSSATITTSTQTYTVTPIATSPLTFTLQQLGVGASMTLEYKAQVIFNLPSSVTEITNSVEGIGYTSSGTVSGFSNTTITRNSTSSVEMTKSATATNVVPNQTFTYNLTITNGENETATLTNITDKLPTSFTLTQVQVNIGTGSTRTLSSSDYSLSGTNELVVSSIDGERITVPANGSTILSITGYLS